MTKYMALTEYLNSRSELFFTISFAELDHIVELPPSAKKHPAWWANSRNAHSQASGWLDAGFNASPDFVTGRVRFQRGAAQGKGARWLETTPRTAPLRRSNVAGVGKQWSEFRDRVTSTSEGRLPTDGFTRAGLVKHKGLNLSPPAPRVGRHRHRYGLGPFARLIMPPLPEAPGLYLWQEEADIVYVGQTRTPLRQRLGSQGYSTISGYNTLAREPGRHNGGQETNCRVNALANEALSSGRALSIWYRVADASDVLAEEARWMATFGTPRWNLRVEQP
jgi:hypothetical protein